MIEIYTDGSTHPTNPGPGGFGIVITKDNKIINTYGKQFTHTTNNRMEMSAILWCLANYGKYPEEVIVYSDSSYAINTFTNWMSSWQRNNWRKSDNQPPENLDIIQTYLNLLNMGYKITLKKVKGHSGVEFNELADKLARTGGV